MDFKVNSKQLEKLLTKIIPAVPTRTPMTILENFLLEIKSGLLTIYATDMEISLKSSINILAEKDIKIVVPARMLYETVRSFKDTSIDFTITENKKLTLKTSTGEYSFSYIDAKEFPEIPSFPQQENAEDINEFTISGNDLKNAFDLTAFAMSKEEMRPAMTGTLISFNEEGIRFVATDGHRLVNLLKTGHQTNINEQYIVPERAITVLLKILDDKEVKVFVNKTHISFVLSDIELISRLIGQKYPDYQSVIPIENEFALKINTKDLLSSIKRMMIFSPTNSRRVKFSISANMVEISAEDVDSGSAGKESILCEYSGDPIDIGFNSSYVSDVLSHLNYEEVYFKLHSSTKAVIINPDKNKENENLMMLLMPVRLNN